MPTVSGIIKILKQIKSSPTSTDIVTSNIAQNIRVEDNSIEFDIALPEHMRETAQLYAQSAKKLIKEKGPDFDIKINIKLLKSQVMPESEKLLHNLKKVRHIIAISSCKGGVGKSTVAANVAQELAQQGHKVGLIDADIYGPSIPTLFNLQSVKVQTKNDSFVPIEKNNLKLMSFGFLLGDQAAVMRGPIVTRYVQQMLLGTEWGELDYLLIDMPPGTGDVHLTITQTINLSGAVIITTPHTLSLIDVARGILMFEKVSVPIYGVVENMSYFLDPTNKKHYIFGQSNIDKLQTKFGIKTLSEIPIQETLSQTRGDYSKNKYISNLTKTLKASMQEMEESKNNIPTVSFDSHFITLNWPKGDKWVINNRILRLNSKDALSVDEMTGKQLIKNSDIREDIAPVKILPLGNYAIGINWNDGHNAGIYPYSLIEELMEGSIA